MIASGVRSSWEALAANLCCSATCASNLASMVSKASASSRNSSLRPGSRIRWDSDPVAALRVASEMRVRGASIRPASSHPPSRPNTSRKPSTAPAAGAKLRARPTRVSTSPGTGAHVWHISQQVPPHGSEQQGTCQHEERGVAEGEFEANTQNRSPIHGLLPHARLWLGADAVPGAGHGGDDLGFAEAFAQCRDRDPHGVGERVGVRIPRPFQ